MKKKQVDGWIPSWQKGKLYKYLVDEMTKWQDSKLTIWHNEETESCYSGKLTKWQIDVKSMLTKCQVYEMTRL